MAVTLTKTEQVKKDVLEFLQRNKTAVVATASLEGQPQAATITYVIDDSFDIYFVTKKSSQKFFNISNNPNVAVVVGTDPGTIATVQMQGVAQIIEDQKHFMIRYLATTIDIAKPEWWPLSRMPGSDFVLIRIKPTWLSWLNLDKSEYPDTYREDYQQIIP